MSAASLKASAASLARRAVAADDAGDHVLAERLRRRAEADRLLSASMALRELRAVSQ